MSVMKSEQMPTDRSNAQEVKVRGKLNRNEEKLTPLRRLLQSQRREWSAGLWKLAHIRQNTRETIEPFCQYCGNNFDTAMKYISTLPSFWQDLELLLESSAPGEFHVADRIFCTERECRSMAEQWRSWEHCATLQQTEAIEELADSLNEHRYYFSKQEIHYQRRENELTRYTATAALRLSNSQQANYSPCVRGGGTSRYVTECKPRKVAPLSNEQLRESMSFSMTNLMYHCTI